MLLLLMPIHHSKLLARVYRCTKTKVLAVASARKYALVRKEPNMQSRNMSMNCKSPSPRLFRLHNIILVERTSCWGWGWSERHVTQILRTDGTSSNLTEEANICAMGCIEASCQCNPGHTDVGWTWSLYISFPHYNLSNGSVLQTTVFIILSSQTSFG